MGNEPLNYAGGQEAGGRLYFACTETGGADGLLKKEGRSFGGVTAARERKRVRCGRRRIKRRGDLVVWFRGRVRLDPRARALGCESVSWKRASSVAMPQLKLGGAGGPSPPSHYFDHGISD